MKGINYLTNDRGDKIAVQIDLKKYSEIWEDIQDIMMAKERANEPLFTLDYVITDLKKKGKL